MAPLKLVCHKLQVINILLSTFFLKKVKLSVFLLEEKKCPHCASLKSATLHDKHSPPRLPPSPVAYILEKLHDCHFFDGEIQPSIFFLTLHDAMLRILEKHPESTENKSDHDKVKLMKHSLTRYLEETAI